MNQRLVESVAQIVLAMSDDERRLLGRKLQHAGMPQLTAPTDTDKSLRVAEIAQDIQDFEEAYQAPLSALPADQWTLAGAEAAEATEKAHEAVDEKPPMPTAEELTRAQTQLTG
ncbi:MAG: hypothetical protein WA783_02870 [Phormidesmis sp.]